MIELKYWTANGTIHQNMKLRLVFIYEAAFVMVF